MSASAAAFAAGLGNQLMNIASNAWNAEIAMQKQKEYYALIGSPEAQMEAMKKAGINPFTAAGNISGMAGDSPVGQSMQGAPNMVGDMADFMNSNLNKTVEEKTKSETGKNIADTGLTEEETKSQKLANTLDEETLQAQIRRRIADASLGEKNTEYLSNIVERQPEMLEIEIGEMKARTNHYIADSSLIDKKRDLVEEQIKEVTEHINEMKANMKYLISSADLNQALKELNEARKTYQELINNKQEIENERYKAYDEAPWYIKKYEEIKAEKGQESANKFLDTCGNLIEDYHQKQALGEANANPLTRELNTMYDAIIETSQRIEETKEMIKETEDWLEQNKHNVLTKEYANKKAFVNSALETLKELEAEMNNEMTDWTKIKRNKGIEKTVGQKVGEWTNTLRDVGTLLIGIGSIKGAVLPSTPTNSQQTTTMYDKNGNPTGTTQTSYEYGKNIKTGKPEPTNTTPTPTPTPTPPPYTIFNPGGTQTPYRGIDPSTYGAFNNP